MRKLEWNLGLNVVQFKTGLMAQNYLKQVPGASRRCKILFNYLD